MLEHRSKNDNELHVKAVMKRGNQLKIDENEYELSDVDSHRNEIIEELKNVKCNDLENLVFRIQLTYREIEYLLDVKHISASSTGYTLPPGIYKISDLSLMIKSLLPNEGKVSITKNDIRLRSKLGTKKTKKFTEKTFSILYYVLPNHIQELLVIMKGSFKLYQVQIKFKTH